MTELVYPPVELSLSGGQGDAGGNITLGLTMANDMNVAGIQVDFVDTPDAVTLTSAIGIGRAETASVATSNLANGGNRILLYFMQGDYIPVGDDTVVELTFAITNGFEGEVAIATENLVLSDVNGNPLDGSAIGNTVVVTIPYQMTTISVGNIAGEQGETVVLNVDMSNADPVGGLQMDIIDGSGSLIYTSIAAVGRASTFNISASTLPDGITRFIMFSMTGDVVAPGGGTIIEITYQIPENALIGTFGLTCGEIVLSDSMGDSMPAEAIDGTITISEPCVFPFADAGTDQVVEIVHDGIPGGMATVTLDGSASFDPSGYNLAFLWIMDGTEISSMVTFDAELNVGTYPFILQVNNSCGLMDVDTIFVEVLPEQNYPPVANAGVNQTIGSDGSGPISVTLDGVASSDPDGDTLVYLWSLDGVEISTDVSFVTDLDIGDYVFTLTVTDTYGAESLDTVTISVVQTATTQVISLGAGWNIFSSYILPENGDMLSIIQPLIDADVLEAVIDEAGNRVFFFFGAWINQIGNMANTEGYYINVSADIDLEITGSSVVTPFDIPLSSGWNIMGYPSEIQTDALASVQSLIDEGTLNTVIDEAGNRIFFFFGAWINQIGNLKAGEGYYINVNAPSNLVFEE